MLSVVVPTRNRAQLLDHCLKALANQDLPPSEYEVLVIDNGSTDETRSVAQSYRYRGNIRYLYESTPGLHVGRHAGLQKARGEVLAYTDDDAQPLPTWLSSIADCFKDPQVALVGGNNIPIFESSPPDWLRRLWEATHPTLRGHMISDLSILEFPPGRRPLDPLMVWGCNFSVRRSVLVEAGGFHPDGMPKDLLHFRGDGETHVSRHIARRGLPCLFDSGASVYHFVSSDRMTVEYFRQRAFAQGVSDSYSFLRLREEQSRSRVKAAARETKRKLLRGLQAISALTERHRDLRKVKLAQWAAYNRGYTFHRQAYRTDATVRTWVHKPDYFKETHPCSNA